MGGSTPTADLVPWNKIDGLKRSKLDVLIERRRQLKLQMAQLKEQLSTLDNKLLNALVTADVKTVSIEGARATVVAGGPTSKFDKKKAWTRLLELGVKEKVVSKAWQDATKPGKDREPYVKVTEPGDREEEE